MANYEKGQTLDLIVTGLRKNSIGDYYIAVTDDENEYRIFNVLKCQLAGELPEKLHVIVKSIDSFGRYKLTQDVQRILSEHYQKDKLYSFEITGIQKDNNDKPYYTIEDDFAEQYFYIHGEQTHNVGDILCLDCKGPNQKGWLEYEEYVSKPIEESATPAPVAPKAGVKLTNNFPKYGPESQTVEYKSSIVFSADTSAPDVETQMKLIVEELAALMNTKGGVLVIGVSDENKNFEITGIEKDFQYLNDDSTDEFTYHLNADGYRQKILHKLNYLCPMLAGSLVSFDFKEKNKHQYCIIKVEKSTRPIWVKGEKDLFIRQDGRMKRIWGEPMSEHIFKMMKESVDSAAGGAVAVATLDDAHLSALIKKIINAQKPTIELPKPPEKVIDYWLVWQADGSWQRQRAKSTKCAMQVPVYKDCGMQIVLFCYGTGHVVAVELAKLRAKVNLNQPQKSQWTPGKTPTNIFVVEPSSYLVIKSIDYNGTESVKLHAVTDFTPVAKGTAVGAPILPDGSKPQSYHIVSAEYKGKFQNLIVPKNKRATAKGEPLNSGTFQDKIAYLEALIK